MKLLDVAEHLTECQEGAANATQRDWYGRMAALVLAAHAVVKVATIPAFYHHPDDIPIERCPLCNALNDLYALEKAYADSN